jgi:very-short-patch-repair endonuclease
MQPIISYNNKLKERAKHMRNNSSQAEVALWAALKNKQLGIRFVRQRMIQNYIVDFYCKELQLAIEIDDKSHDMKYEYDNKRTAELNTLGVTVIRFSNEDVLKNREGVVESIKKYIKEHSFF